MMGILAQHAPSYSKGVLYLFCNSYSSVIWSATIFLLAVTTALPFSKASLTISKAASGSSISSEFCQDVTTLMVGALISVFFLRIAADWGK